MLTCLLLCRLRQLIAQGAIGEVQHFQGTFVTHIGEETPRLYDLNLGGGALLDIGVSSGAFAVVHSGCLYAARAGLMLNCLYCSVGWRSSAGHWDGALRTQMCCV